MLKVVKTDSGMVANGIICDITGDESVDTFVYYSADIEQISIKNRQVSNHGKQFDLDVGERCFEEMKKRCMSNIEARVGGTVACDFCGHKLAGNIQYFVFKLYKVSVDKAKCVHHADGSHTLTPDVDSLPTDFELCNNCYKELTDVVMRTRGKHGRS